jgi:uncharacterized protein (TIGR00290 family)
LHSSEIGKGNVPTPFQKLRIAENRNVTPQKVIIGWSGGKDSALALYEVQRSDGYEIVELLTTVTQDYNRVSIHGVRCVLLEQQAEALGLPLEEMLLSKGAADKDYQTELLTILGSHMKTGVCAVVFGDIFLQDVKNFRDDLMSKIGMHGIYPLWGRDSRGLAEKFIDLGFKAVVTVIDSQVLGKEFSGREYDRKFLADLPKGG